MEQFRIKFIHPDVICVKMTGPGWEHNLCEKMFDSVKEFLESYPEIEQNGWFAIYDMTDVESYDSTVISAFIDFVKWCQEHNRIAAAHIFPVHVEHNFTAMVRNVIYSFIKWSTKSEVKKYKTVESIEEAITWFRFLKENHQFQQ